MKTIKLTRMELRNFKGVANAEYTFGDLCIISGDNATGKSTIFDAYLWCLFDKNQQGNQPKVQPLDENNEVKHKLTTSVRLVLSIDNTPFFVERSLKEDWTKPRGTTEFVCKGTKSEYAINDVPMTKTQYNAKLEEIAPLDKWFLLSAVGIIPAMDQKTCRAELQAIAPAIDERTLAQPFQAVLEALTKGLNVDELQAQNKQTKSRVKAELDTIPASLEAQDRLRVEDDFKAIEQQLNEVKDAIASNRAEIDSLQTAVVDEAAIQRANTQRKELADINQRIVAITTTTDYNYKTNTSRYQRKLQDLTAETSSIQQRIEVSRQTSQHYLHLIKQERARIAELRNLWIAKAAEEYNEPQVTTTCPACGQPLPIDRVELAKEKAQQEWNSEKVRQLQNYQQDAEDCKMRIDNYKEADARLEEGDKADTQRLDAIANEMATIEKALAELVKPNDELQAKKEYQDLLSKKAELENTIRQTAQQSTDMDDNRAKADELKAKIEALLSKQEQLLRRLAGRDLNARVDAERARLNGLQTQLADALAQAEGIDAQITAYRKAKITAVENSVSSLFTLVRWKMYEPNLTNDGEKEICQAIIDGIPYEQQNRAMQINAGIDIANAFGRAYQISTPLFIDNAEAVNKPLETQGQCIRLAVSKDKTLQFTRTYNENSMQ